MMQFKLASIGLYLVFCWTFTAVQAAQVELTTGAFIGNTNLTVTTDAAQDPGHKTSSTTDSFLPTLNSNIVTNLVPSLKKNMMDMKNKEASENQDVIEEVTAEPRDFFSKRRRLNKSPVLTLSPNMFRSSVKNATAAEILLKKLQANQKTRTYHDPGFKPKRLVRVRPRAKTLAELARHPGGSDQEESGTTTLLPDSSSTNTMIAANALLLDHAQDYHRGKVFAPQGSQPFDWSHRHNSGGLKSEFYKNRYRIYRNQLNGQIVQEDNAGDKTTEGYKSSTEAASTTIEPPSTEEGSTEIHVVTSITADIDTTAQAQSQQQQTRTTETPMTSTVLSYQYSSIGTPKTLTTPILELERLFLNEHLQDPANAGNKPKRKVEGFFADNGKPVQVDSSIQVVSELYENNDIFEPSEAPTDVYQAPTNIYEIPAEFSEITAVNSLQPERVKDFSNVPDDAINTDEEEYEYLEPEQVTEQEALDRVAAIAPPTQNDAEKSSDQTQPSLDNTIIKAIEEALEIDVPVDSQLRHRDASPRPNRDHHPGDHQYDLDDMIIKAIEEALEIDVPVDSQLRHREASPRPNRDHHPGDQQYDAFSNKDDQSTVRQFLNNNVFT
jgi:hypothetical protein